jgi:Ca-activated chloride channel family protein
MNLRAAQILKSLFITILLAVSCFVDGQQQNKEIPVPTTRILFVFDASQSMYGRWQSDMKMHIAQKLLGNVLDSLKNVDNLELALRVYGHQKPFPPQDCDDTRLEIPFGKNNADRIKYKLSTINPKGTTPIAYALSQAGSDFPECDNCRNIIILITDGVEECDGDPCEVSKMLQKQGIALKPFVIGIGTDFSESLNCVGTYFPASSEKAFTKALNVVISQALNSTTAQVNLLDDSGKPTETNVNMTFYDMVSGNVVYNLVHTLNNKGLPDTLLLDPLLKYKVTVHTIPPLHLDSVEINPGKHTIIPFDAGQGFLSLNVGGNWRTLKNLQAIVRRHGEMETLNVQNFGSTQKYLNGVYDLEVLGLPRIKIDSVVIRQSHTTTIEIPMPGIAVIKRNVDGIGTLYVERNNELELIYKLSEDKDYVENLVLQPGNYRVVFRSKWADKAVYTIEEKFEVKPGKTIEIKLN